MDKKIKEVIKIICKKHFVPEEELLGSRKIAYIVKARAELVKSLRDNLGLSFPQIGKIIGGKDHTSIMYLYKDYRSKEDLIKEYKKGNPPTIIWGRLDRVECLSCGKVFYKKSPQHKYCSHKCSYLYRGKFVKKVCAKCGKIFKTSNSSKKYCSNFCRWQRRNFIGQPIIREYFLERANFQCEKCGETLQLECHHKLPLYKGGSDSKDNIIVLCPHCHWKEHNKGKNDPLTEMPKK